MKLTFFSRIVKWVFVKIGAFFGVSVLLGSRSQKMMGENDKHGKELEVAVRLVHLACSLCQKVQQRLPSVSREQVASKDDDSLVTVADFGVQAIVSLILSESFRDQSISIIAEEDVETLSKADSASLLKAVVHTVNECLAEASKYGLESPNKTLEASHILEAISRCNSTGGPSGQHWVLDPVDGTLGFVRGDQYAIALALIEDGKVVIGVLGCPNYPSKKDCLDHDRHPDCMSSPKTSDTSRRGCVMYAKKGTGEAWMEPLIYESEKLEWPNSAQCIFVSDVNDPALATFCEPVERANSNHSFTAGVAHDIGVKKKPLRVHSMVKYAAIARGDAEIFMKFARSGYKEKIWDHAAGVLIVEEAGGIVTDAGGKPLDFSKGIYLEGLDRGVVACCGSTMHQKLVSAVYASWESSSL